MLREEVGILIVDDVNAMRVQIKELLKSFGFRKIVVAANGEEAIRIADRDGVTIDLLLSDVLMPGTTGSALAEELRKRHSGLKVLLMSGYDESYLAAHTSPVAGAEFLEKPFTPSDLVSKVQSTLRPAA